MNYNSEYNNDYPDEYQDNQDEQYNEDNEYNDENQDYNEYDQYSDNNQELNENLEDIINSYNPDEISVEALEGIAGEVRDRVYLLKNEQLPPVEDEINEINAYIDKRRSDLEKAKKSSVFVNDISDDVEFHYSDHRARHIEEEIKEQLNKRYVQEKLKFNILEELEEIEARHNLCNHLLESYHIRDKIDELLSYSEEMSEEIGFDIENYDSITSIEFESLETYESNWNTIIEILGRSFHYQNRLTYLFDYFSEVEPQLEEKDPETKFVFDEKPKYADLEPQLQDLTANYEETLFSSIAALYELTANYEVGEDYLPENKQYAINNINKIKSIIMSMRTSLDNYKLDYKDFRKSINNIFVLLNKANQSIENQQKLLKTQQETKIRKIRDIMNIVSKNSVDGLRQSTNEINNMIGNLLNYGASNNQTEALQFYFSVKAKYPVDSSMREDLVDALNDEIHGMNIMEIDLMCKLLEAKYDNKRGLYIDSPMSQVKTISQVAEQRSMKQETQSPTQSLATSNLNPPPKGKTGNLDFLGNMYLKEAQRSKGQWAAKSYLKAIEAYMKCAEIEEDITKKLTFLKLALKSAKDAVLEKEDSATLYAYANAYRELAYNHSSKINPQTQLKIGDNFVNAAKFFIREENIEAAKNAFSEAKEAYEKSANDDTIRLRLESLKKFLR
ncbi:MAG: hypothetical protein U0354_14650 [Candidatus Sericytochromatia bacterium]